MTKPISRRNFVCSAAAGIVLPGLKRSGPTEVGAVYRGKLCFFSKPLPEMDWKRLAASAKLAGFQGIDLTVRSGGHVRPERAGEDLPKAAATIRDHGLEVPMITTELVSASDPTAQPIVSTAAKLLIPFLKPGYYQYKLTDVRRELEEAGEKFRSLVQLAAQHGVQVGYHNHEEYMGAPVWDMARVIEPLDPKWVGYYFDPRHATAEGGVGGWKISTNLVLPRLKMIAVKDFYWEKTTKGWRDINCPLGQGMVNWKYFFGIIAGSGFQGPISLHLEYEVNGPTPAAREENVLAAAQRDLAFLQACLREAYEAPNH